MIELFITLLAVQPDVALPIRLLNAVTWWIDTMWVLML